MNEFDWLADQRPEVRAPDEETTAYAKAALLAYAVRGGERRERVAAAPRGLLVARPQLPGPAAAPPPSRRRPGRGRRVALLATAAAALAIALVGALPSGHGPAKRLGAPATAEAAPLVKFSKRIQAQPAPIGDASLVLRRQDVRGEGTVTGADLYLDDGHYYYAPTLAQLRGSGTSKDTGTDVINREVVAARAGVDLAPAEARKGVVAAILGGMKMRPGAQSTKALDDNHIWGACVDALAAGAGDQQVRAGVMRLLATIETASVQDRGATLEITNTDFGGGYQETLVVDAKTGVLEKLIGGDPAKAAEVTITYDVKRVTAKDVLGN